VKVFAEQLCRASNVYRLVDVTIGGLWKMWQVQPQNGGKVQDQRVRTNFVVGKYMHSNIEEVFMLVIFGAAGPPRNLSMSR
jgi:hypothetical protein